MGISIDPKLEQLTEEDIRIRRDGCHRYKRFGIEFYRKVCIRCRTSWSIGCRVWKFYFCWRNPLVHNSPLFLQVGRVLKYKKVGKKNLKIRLNHSDADYNVPQIMYSFRSQGVAPGVFSHIFDMIDGQYYRDRKVSNITVSRVTVATHIVMVPEKDPKRMPSDGNAELMAVHHGYAATPKRYYLVLEDQNKESVKVEIPQSAAQEIANFKDTTRPLGALDLPPIPKEAF